MPVCLSNVRISHSRRLLLDWLLVDQCAHPNELLAALPDALLVGCRSIKHLVPSRGIHLHNAKARTHFRIDEQRFTSNNKFGLSSNAGVQTQPDKQLKSQVQSGPAGRHGVKVGMIPTPLAKIHHVCVCASQCTTVVKGQEIPRHTVILKSGLAFSTPTAQAKLGKVILKQAQPNPAPLNHRPLIYMCPKHKLPATRRCSASLQDTAAVGLVSRPPH